MVVGINPEPWSVGEVNCWGKGRGTISPSIKMQVYQKALAEELEGQGATELSGPLAVHFYFWRTTSDGGKPADASNMTKATEDALQGVCYGNDRNNRRVTGEIMQQDTTTSPALVIEIDPYWQDPHKFQELTALINAVPQVTAFQDSDYEAPEEPF